jgi:hypothetical protein
VFLSIGFGKCCAFPSGVTPIASVYALETKSRVVIWSRCFIIVTRCILKNSMVLSMLNKLPHEFPLWLYRQYYGNELISQVANSNECIIDLFGCDLGQVTLLWLPHPLDETVSYDRTWVSYSRVFIWPKRCKIKTALVCKSTHYRMRRRKSFQSMHWLDIFDKDLFSTSRPTFSQNS